MSRVKQGIATAGLAASIVGLIALVAFLQLTVHDPKHVLLTVVTGWGVLSLAVGLVVGHCALSEHQDHPEMRWPKGTLPRR